MKRYLLILSSVLLIIRAYVIVYVNFLITITIFLRPSVTSVHVMSSVLRLMKGYRSGLHTLIRYVRIREVKCRVSGIGVDIIGTHVFGGLHWSAETCGKRVHASDRRACHILLYIVRPVPRPLTPIKETHVSWNLEFFECAFPPLTVRCAVPLARYVKIK